jgi:hypothetical protein
MQPQSNQTLMHRHNFSRILFTEPDLLGFDTAPAPAPVAATPASEEFGAFQATPAPAAPAPAAADDFADFGSLRSAPVPAPVIDPFAAPPAAHQAAQPQQPFNAFGNNNMAGNTMGSAMMAGGMTNGMAAPMNNNTVGGMSGMTNAFGNMNMGATGGMQPQQQSSMPATANDDDFGDFSTATPSFTAPAVTMPSSDPLNKLINLDGLSKNPSKNKPNTNQQPMGMGMGNMNNGMGNPLMSQQNVPVVQQPGTLRSSL